MRMRKPSQGILYCGAGQLHISIGNPGCSPSNASKEQEEINREGQLDPWTGLERIYWLSSEMRKGPGASLLLLLPKTDQDWQQGGWRLSAKPALSQLYAACLLFQTTQVNHHLVLLSFSS